jgi:hypothetical protein
MIAIDDVEMHKGPCNQFGATIFVRSKCVRSGSSSNQEQCQGYEFRQSRSHQPNLVANLVLALPAVS